MHSASSFIQARFQGQRKARSIIQNRQRMAPPFRTSNVSLKIHLPQIVWILPLKSYKFPMFVRFSFIDKSIAFENLADRTCSWHLRMSHVLQAALDLSTAPTSVFYANSDDRFFHLFCNPIGTDFRPARKIIQPFFSSRFEPLQPLVTRLATDSKSSAQDAEVSAISGQVNKLFSQRNHTCLFPRHGCAPSFAGAIIPS